MSEEEKTPELTPEERETLDAVKAASENVEVVEEDTTDQAAPVETTNQPLDKSEAETAVNAPLEGQTSPSDPKPVTETQPPDLPKKQLKKLRTYWDLSQEERDDILSRDPIYQEYTKNIDPNDANLQKWKKNFAIDRVNTMLEKEIYSRQRITKFWDIFRASKLPKEIKGKTALKLVGLIVALVNYISMWILVLFPNLGPFEAGLITILISGGLGILVGLLVGWEINAVSYAEEQGVDVEREQRITNQNITGKIQ